MSTSRSADPRLQHLGDAADLALPRQEDEDRAGLLRERRERHARDLVLDAGAWGPPDVAGRDGPGAAFAFDQRRGAEEGANPRAVERRRHDQNPQVFAQAGLRVERERKAEIGLERALVKLVEQDRADALQRRIVEDHAGEHALGHDLDARAGGDEALEPDAKADRLADALAQGRRHARRRGARGEPARLEEEEALAPGPGLVEKRERRARRLAGAGRGDKHRARARGERRLEGAERVVDRQGLGEGAHRPSLEHAAFRRNPHREARDGIENLYDRLRAGRRLQLRQNRNSPCYPLLTGKRGPRRALDWMHESDAYQSLAMNFSCNG